MDIQIFSYYFILKYCIFFYQMQLKHSEILHSASLMIWCFLCKDTTFCRYNFSVVFSSNLVEEAYLKYMSPKNKRLFLHDLWVWTGKYSSLLQFINKKINPTGFYIKYKRCVFCGSVFQQDYSPNQVKKSIVK